MKVAINADYGGFSLSPAAMKLFIEMGYTEPHWDEAPDYGGHKSRKAAIKAAIAYGFVCCERNDKRLIHTIEALGTKKASGKCANIKIVEIPDDVKFTVEEYDGSEWVAEVHHTWR